MIIALTMLAAGVGAVLRLRMAHAFDGAVPYATLAVNLIAAFALGALAPLAGDQDPIIRIGLLGAASTWSTLALEVSAMLRAGRAWLAGGYLTTSVVGGVILAFLGLRL